MEDVIYLIIEIGVRLMKCPNDQIEMEKGYMDAGSWISGNKPINYSLFAFFGRITKWVTAWRCPKCGKVDLYTEDKK